MAAIYLAIGSMFFASVNDFVYKLYGRSRGAVGIYMAVMGVVSTLIFTAVLFFTGGSLLDKEAAVWGLVSGFFAVVGNILLVEVMAVRQVGICATIYRLNLAPAAMLAFIFLDEPVTASKVLGISAAVVAVLLLSGIKFGNFFENIDAVLWVVVIAAILRAFMGIAYKQGLSAGAGGIQLLVFNGIIRFVMGLVYAVLFEKKAAPKRALPYGVGSGVLISATILFMMLALERGQASVVLPVAQLSFLLTTIIGIIFLGEHLTARKTGGLVMALICIAFMAIDA